MMAFKTLQWLGHTTISFWPHVLWLSFAPSAPATVTSPCLEQVRLVTNHLSTFEQVVPVYELPLIQHCRLLPLLQVFVQMSLFSNESFPKLYLNSSCSPSQNSWLPLLYLYCLIRLENTNHFLNHNVICLLLRSIVYYLSPSTRM